jgi:Immunoglobulin V-set domain
VASRRSVIVGSNVTFKCPLNTDEDILWDFYPLRSLEVVRLLELNDGQYASLSSRTSVTRSKSKSSLFIVDAQMSDVGRYECLELHTDKDGVIFQLDVYRKLQLPNTLRRLTFVEALLSAT